MDKGFYNSLILYTKSHDNDNANNVIMRELGKILVKDRENFITLLRFVDLDASELNSDKELVDMFVDNINNRKLMVGASFLVNHHNRKEGFDGDKEVSDTGVKAVHRVMFNYFNGPEEYANAGGIAESIAQSVGEVSKFGTRISEGQQKKKYGAMDALTKKQDAKAAMAQSIIEQRKLQQQALIEQQKAEAKRKKTIIIAGASIAGALLLIGGIYLYTQRKKG